MSKLEPPGAIDFASNSNRDRTLLPGHDAHDLGPLLYQKKSTIDPRELVRTYTVI